MFGVEYQDCSKANISCDKYRYFFKDALNIAERTETEGWEIYTGQSQQESSLELLAQAR